MKDSWQDILDDAFRTLREGGTLLYPTDTIWGIGCDACNADAVEKIYRIKQRDRHKSMLVLARTEWVTTDDDELQALLNAERPTTVILPLERLPSMPKLAHNLPAEDGTIGVRVPRHDFCQQLLALLGRPIVSTSANFSGQPSPKGYDDIALSLKEEIDYCVAPLPCFENGATTGSRIVKLMADGSLSILRP